MKKILILSLFIIMASVNAQSPASAESVFEPQWSEFCPPLYENAVFKHTKEKSKKYMENNYWALRKVKFEKSVAECKANSKTSDELRACYNRVSSLERNKTNQRGNARQEKIQDENRQIQDGRNYFWYY